MANEPVKLGGITVNIKLEPNRSYATFTDKELRNSVKMALSGQLKDSARLAELEKELLHRAAQGTLPTGIYLVDQIRTGEEQEDVHVA